METREHDDRDDLRFRKLFDGVRVALWDQDFSPLVNRLEGLRSDGISDIRSYFRDRPELLKEAVELVKVRDVNAYAVELLDADDKHALVGSLGSIFLPETYAVFLEEIAALWEGRRRFESDTRIATLKGRKIDILITIAWDGERCEHSLVSIFDITRQKSAQRRFEVLNSVAQTVSSDLELERVVQSVTDSATALSGAKFGAFFYNAVNESGESFMLYTLSGAPREAFASFGMPRNTSIFAPTFRGEAIVRCDDVRADPRYGHNAPHNGMPKGHLPVVSYLAVPVIARSGEVLGGLFFGHDEPGVFTQETEEIITGVAAHAAIAIDNARLLRTTQEALRQRHEAERDLSTLAAIVETSQDGIISKDLDGRVLSWNKGAERLFGYTAEEIVGKSVTILFPPHLLAEEEEILGRLREGTRIDHYDTVRQHKDGQLLDISLTISPLRDKDGRIIGASKIARNITERKRSVEELARRMQEQAALYKLTDRLYHSTQLDQAFDAALEAIIAALGCSSASILLFDENETMRFVAWRGLSEAYRTAVDGHTPWDADTKDAVPIYVPDIEQAALEPTLSACLKTEGIGALAFIPLFSEGRVVGKFMAYYDAAHVFSPEEEAVAIAIARQLGFHVQRMRAESARRQAEHDLRDSEERLRMALEAGNMGAWEWEFATNTVIWSPTLERIHGLEPGSFGGTLDDFRSDVHPDDRETVEAAVRATLEDQSPYHVSYRIILPDGSLRWLEAFGSPLESESGCPEKLIGICMDITARKLAETHRETLIAELSHRVKNALATVLAVSRQTFSRQADPHQAHRSFEARIRALAQAHGRLAETQWTGVSMQTLLEDELSPFRDEGRGNVNLRGPLVSLSPRQTLSLGMGFHELATNAAKYGAFSTPGGRVDVTWTASKDELRIEWTERGGPPVEAPQRTGFGRLLLERVVTADLNAAVMTAYDPEGVKCTFRVPLTAQNPEADA